MAKKVKITKGGQTVYPVTVMDAVVHPDLRVASSKLIEEVNVSKIFPMGGIDGTNKYTLETAIAMIPTSLRSVGIKCSFLNEGEVAEKWEYLGGGFTDTASWVKAGANQLLQDILASSTDTSFNKFNRRKAEYKNITDDGKVREDASNERMIYSIIIDSNVTKLSTNAYRVFLYKKNKFVRQNTPTDSIFLITSGEADEIKLLMVNQKEDYYYLYFNSEVKKYYPFGVSENDIQIQEGLSNAKFDIKNIESSIEDMSNDIDNIKISDEISSIATIDERGYIKISDGYMTGKDETGNYSSRSIVSVPLENGYRISFSAKTDLGKPFYTLLDSSNKVLLTESATNSPETRNFDISLLDYPTAVKLLYGTDFMSPDLAGALYYDNELPVDLDKAKQQIEENTNEISSINSNLKGSLYKKEIDENSVIQIGQGYIEIAGNTVNLDSPLKDVGNWNNRRVLKLNISNILYIGELRVKSDNDYPLYVICDASGNVLSKKVSTGLGQVEDVDLDMSGYQNAKWLLWGQDYANPVYTGYVHYNSPLSIDLIEIKRTVESLQPDLSQYSLKTEYFQVRVNTERPQNNIAEQNDYIADNYDYDNCYFALPKTISERTKLVIACHGGGQSIGTQDETTNQFIRQCVCDTFRALGYATLATNGMPDSWAEQKGLEDASAPIGNWMALESIIKAYDYIINKYKFIDQTGCYIWASSQGGMVAENAVELSDIPFRACCYEAPALSMRYVQLYLGFRIPWIEALYGFDSVETYDKNKCLGLDPFIRNMDGDIPIEGTTFVEIAVEGGIEKMNVRKFRKNAPLMIQQGMDDGAVSPIITQAYIKSIQNAGSLAEFKGYSGIGHGVSSLTTKYGMPNSQPRPLYTTTGILDAAKWFYRYGGYPIPAGEWGNGTE